MVCIGISPVFRPNFIADMAYELGDVADIRLVVDHYFEMVIRYQLANGSDINDIYQKQVVWGRIANVMVFK